MSETSEPTLALLLAALAELEQAGRSAGAPAESVALFERTRERIRHLMDPGEYPEPEDPSDPPALSGPEELPDALADLVASAIEDGAPAWVTNLLCTTHMRLSSQLSTGAQGSGEGNRLAPRFDEDRTARLLRANGTELEVRVVDRSPLGLGLLSPEDLDPREVVRLHVREDHGGEAHLGEVVFSLDRGGDAFHVGVELLASE